METDVRQLHVEAQRHRGYWNDRNRRFEDWYRILTLDDSDVYQEDMECVISNDPVTFFKKARRILSTGITYNIPTDMLANPESADVSTVIRLLEYVWQDKEKSYRRRGRQGWLYEFVSYLLMLGWYDVLAYANHSDGLVAEVRNPAECFPMYGEEGLISHFHIYRMECNDARRKCARNGWAPLMPIRGNTTEVKDWWYLDEDGKVWNAISIGGQLVKEKTPMNMAGIPILSGPASGMPDRGSIIPADSTGWTKRYGEGIVADNADLYLNYNRQLTFMQQIVRDVAQPKLKEKSDGDTPIINPDTMYKRGAIFRMGREDEVEPLTTPPIPLEMSTHSRDLEGMLQRGSFPWSMFGGLAQAITSYTMAQITAAAKEILAPYADCLRYVLGEVSQTWLDNMRIFGISYHDMIVPPTFPDALEVKADVPVSIPGDFIQRATLSRMISPDFRMSTRTTMDMLWSEIKDPDREMAAARADDALNHPIAKTINLVTSFRTQAMNLRDAGDMDGAQLFDNAASAAEATIMGQGGGAETQTMRRTPRQEIVPRETTSPQEMLV